jgi:hypothetical protein
VTEPLIRISSSSTAAERVPGQWGMSLTLTIVARDYMTLNTIAKWIETFCALVAR